MDTALAFKAKVNNSYESEPSSGSGSSLSENNDYLNMEIENLNLPNLLKPPPCIDESESYDPTDPNNPNSVKMIHLSSQESPFRGFSESPLEKIKMRLNVAAESKIDSDLSVCNKGGIVEKIYDTIVAEDSCNAVDLPFASQRKLNKEEEELLASKESREAPPPPLATELSFNGRIKSLKIEEEFNNISRNESRINSLINAENSEFAQSFIIRDYNTERSPDLFADEDEDEDGDGDENNEIENSTEQEPSNIIRQDTSNDRSDEQLDRTTVSHPNNSMTENNNFADDATLDCTRQNIDLKERLYRENCKRERELLRRIRKCLSGVPPPPSMTTPQVDVLDMVLSRKEDIFNFFKTIPPSNVNVERKAQCLSLFKPTHSFEDVKSIPWRDILGVRYHGLSYNLSKASESNEFLGLSVIERFIGAETNSSYRRSPSSAKKRNARLKLLTQSPGNRLSHLARRRAVFSSAHLATNLQKSTSSLGPQIAMDKKKTKHRRKPTPKRKTPASKKKYRKTPSSSARKRLFRCGESNKPGPSRETSKRALFQSPAKLIEKQNILPKPQIKPEIATRVEKSKRALFSPEMMNVEPVSKQQASSSSLKFLSQSSAELLLKRKRSDSNYDDEVDEHSNKLFRANDSLTPRTLKIKSQSFCIGAGSSAKHHSLLSSTSTSTSVFSQKETKLEKIANSSTSLSSALSNNSIYSSFASGSQLSFNEKAISRAHSDMAFSTTPSLTENQRKKLLWAVSQALQEKKITTKHENFKQYASVLARVVRRIFQEYYQKTSTSNSETLLRLAKKYVYYVISGRSTDDIYLYVKAQLDESKRMSTSRLTGYIGPEEYKKLKKEQLTQSSVVSSSMLSFHGSMQNLFSNEISMDVFTSSSNQKTAEENWPMELTKSASKQQQQSIQINPSSLQNSSSKSNLGSLALRENSAQKNFTGKDQRNRSPYAHNSGKKITSLSSNDSLHAASSAKAKRQIVFDI